MIDYTGFAHPKGRPGALVKDDRRKVKQSIEDEQDAIVKARSGGICEVKDRHLSAMYHPVLKRCRRPAREIHHLIGGSGRRGVRESALAQNKLHVCAGFDGSCHDLSTRKILQPHWADVNNRAGTVYYVRLR